MSRLSRVPKHQGFQMKYPMCKKRSRVDDASRDTSSILVFQTSLPSLDDKKLDVIIKDINEVKQNLALLVKAKNDDLCEARSVAENREKLSEETKTLLAKITLARSINDIELTGFAYSSERSELCCSVCTEAEHENNATLTTVHGSSLSGMFSYEQSNGLAFAENENLPDQFRNLKKHVKRHIKKSKKHICNLRNETEKQNAAVKMRGNNHEAGMNLGRLCMKLYLKGRPYTDFEDILNLKQAGAK
ncbi:Hypothetical predicted protein, partial [Paramuricea clavata]